MLQKSCSWNAVYFCAVFIWDVPFTDESWNQGKCKHKGNPQTEEWVHGWLFRCGKVAVNLVTCALVNLLFIVFVCIVFSNLIKVRTRNLTLPHNLTFFSNLTCLQKHWVDSSKCRLRDNTPGEYMADPTTRAIRLKLPLVACLRVTDTCHIGSVDRPLTPVLAATWKRVPFPSSSRKFTHFPWSEIDSFVIVGGLGFSRFMLRPRMGFSRVDSRQLRHSWMRTIKMTCLIYASLLWPPWEIKNLCLGEISWW